MKLILHIGMGKTGTSAIQASLRNSHDLLASQKARYLGMWFDMLSPEFRGLKGQVDFFSQSSETMQDHAIKFLEILREYRSTDGSEIFILSNEALSGQSAALAPFIHTLGHSIEINIICYVRNPRDWLPSAYAQWGIRDKINQGPVQSYHEKSQDLVRWYKGPLEWHTRFPDLLSVMSYERAEDIVSDFGHHINLNLDVHPNKVLERPSEEELLLRAIFNSKFSQPVLPDEFDKAIAKDLGSTPALNDLLNKYFNYRVTNSILETNITMFREYRDLFGIDLLEDKNIPDGRQVDTSFIKDRLLDILLDITLTQGIRIRNLERKICRLSRDK